MLRSVLSIVLLVAVGCRAVAAETFPAKPVRFLVGYAPGGGADVLARVIARRLSEAWGQPVVVENRAGAGGTIAAGTVANAAPDGYTILMITSNHTVPSNEVKIAYHPVRSFTPIVEIAYIPSALIVNAALGVSSVKELIDVAKAKPGALNFGSTGPASQQFMDMQLLMQSAGIRMVNVTYKGAGQIVVALLANEVQLGLQPITAFLEAIRSGRLRALAVAGKTRSRLLPDVPTSSEIAALRGFEGSANCTGSLARRDLHLPSPPVCIATCSRRSIRPRCSVCSRSRGLSSLLARRRRSPSGSRAIWRSGRRCPGRSSRSRRGGFV